MSLRRMSVSGLVLPAPVAALASLAFACAPALATKGYVVTGHFGSSGTGDGQFYSSGLNVAVDDSTNVLAAGFEGDVYVTEYTRVQLFNEKGEYLSQFNGADTPYGSLGIGGLGGIAVDDSENALDSAAGDVYVASRVTNGVVIDKFTAGGKYLSQLTYSEECKPESDGVEKCKGTGTHIPFDEQHSIEGLAVDSEGDLWAVQAGGLKSSTRVDEFSANGEFIESFTTGYTEEGLGIAVDSRDDVFVGVRSGGLVVAKFAAATGEKVAELAGGFKPAVDSATNDVFVANPGREPGVEEFGPFGVPSSSPIETFPPGGLRGPAGLYGPESLAVSDVGSTPGTATIYAGIAETHVNAKDEYEGENEVVMLQYAERPDVVTGVASEQASESATVSGTVNPLGVGAVVSCEFEYVAASEYEPGASDPYAKGASVACEKPAAAEVGGGTSPVAVHAKLTGLKAGTLYHYRLGAGNGSVVPHGTEYGQDATFGPPRVSGESVSGVGAGAATVAALIDPEGDPTTYRFEYGTSEAYGSSTPPKSLGAGLVAVSVPARLSGLEPHTAYHFRVVAENASGGTRGADVTFTTLFTVPVVAPGLPDGRVYEMVTPPKNENSDVYVPETYADSAAAAEANPAIPTELPFQAAADGGGVVYVGGPGAGGNGSMGQDLGNEFRATRGQDGWSAQDIQPPGFEAPVYQAFTSDLSVGFLASHESLSPKVPAGLDGYQLLYSHAFGAGDYEPFFTVKPPNRGPRAFKSAGLPGHGGEGETLVYAGSSADLSHVLFEANDALIEGAGGLERELAKDAKESEENYLYDSRGGVLWLVDVLPGANGKVAPGATFGAPESAHSHYGFANAPDFSHVISTDGSKIFWSDGEGEVFVRENSGTSEARTVKVSAGAGARFWTATPDGLYAFYVEGGELYRFDTETRKREALATTGLKGEGVGVQGVIGAGESGEQVYFVASGELVSGATNGQPNLYLHHGGVGGETTFVATLAGADGDYENIGNSPNFGDLEAGVGDRTAEVTPDGGAVVFTSHRRIDTVNFPEGYDNTGCETVGCAEVYVYEAGAGGGLFCASCDPSGAPPPITIDDRSRASFLPPNWSSTEQMRWVSDSGGRVFFDSFEPLVAQDNRSGTLEVYEWERDGEGSCGQPAGCVYMLSGGEAGDSAFLEGASESGGDVFIATRSQLVPADRGNEDVELYDVRVDGVRPLAREQCSGAGCQGVPPAPPIFAAPSSATITGVDDFSPPAPAVAKPKAKSKPVKCRKGLIKRKGRCVKRAGAKAGRSSKRGRGRSHA